MANQTPVTDFSGNHEETILQLAKHLGRDKNRRAVFDVIYGRGEKPRTKKQIAEMLGKPSNDQMIQDAVENLYRHRLICRYENTGVVKDRSRYVYGKETGVRANRAKIIKYADNPAAAKKVPTKRRPEAGVVFVKTVGPSRARARSKGNASRNVKLKLALLMTNPDQRASLQTGIEARYIQEAIFASGRSQDVELKIVPAPTLDSLLGLLNSYSPDVLHFSGHGGDQTLILDNEKAGQDGGTVLDFDMIARVIEATSASPKLLVLVACDTTKGAERFLNKIPLIVAMADAVDDEAACDFSKRFYQSLASGTTVANSLEQAKISLENKGYSDAKLPTLIEKVAGEGNKSLI